MIFLTTLELNFLIVFLSIMMMMLAGFFLIRSYVKILMKTSLYLTIGILAGVDTSIFTSADELVHKYLGFLRGYSSANLS
ncbi:MAG: hypothetical protein RBG13Loki_0576 [Promethearchaeota archaeon CR_4]|nr:MAG: hypothetical protein RBG13Loki_0576 [Candidatus Lokiarchaeota archaeon CR_4]